MIFFIKTKNLNYQNTIIGCYILRDKFFCLLDIKALLLKQTLLNLRGAAYKNLSMLNLRRQAYKNPNLLNLRSSLQDFFKDSFYPQAV